MTLLALALCAVALTAVTLSIYGPHRWHRFVTTDIRPDRAEPSADGYRALTQRNWVVAIPLVVIAACVTLDVTRISDAELEDAVEIAVAQIDGTADDVKGGRIGALVEAELGAEVSVVQITSDDRTYVRGTALPESRFEVTAGSVEPKESQGSISRWDGSAPPTKHSEEAVKDRSVICVSVGAAFEHGGPRQADSVPGHCRGDR